MLFLSISNETSNVSYAMILRYSISLAKNIELLLPEFHCGINVRRKT